MPIPLSSPCCHTPPRRSAVDGRMATPHGDDQIMRSNQACPFNRRYKVPDPTNCNKARTVLRLTDDLRLSRQAVDHHSWNLAEGCCHVMPTDLSPTDSTVWLSCLAIVGNPVMLLRFSQVLEHTVCDPTFTHVCRRPACKDGPDILRFHFSFRSGEVLMYKT